jgi:hypothetical protein
MDNKDVRAILDLEDYLATLGNDRPPVGVFFKALGIDPKVMSNCVETSTQAIHYTMPEMAVSIANNLFKLGVTIGYKYAIKKEMERQFGSIDEETNEQQNSDT